MPTARLLTESLPEGTLAVSEWSWLRDFRNRGMRAFQSQGLPSRRLEEWKYTGLEALHETPFKVDGVSPMEGASILNGWVPEAQADEQRLVFLDGRYQPGFSQPGRMPAEAKLLPLSRALQEERALIQGHLGRIVSPQGQPFAALNSAWLEDGLLLYLPAGCCLERPVHCLFLCSSGSESRASYPRLLIVLEAGAEAQLVEEYRGVATDAGADRALQLTAPLTEIRLAQGAQLTHATLWQEEPDTYHLAGLHVEQAASSRFHSLSLALGGGLCRNDVRVRLAGEGAETLLEGLYLLGGRQHLDHHLRVDHLQPACRSELFYKGILNDQAHGVFNGKAVVHPGAQRTDARQINKNLLLSQGAEMDTKPELQIEADDVQCSHGATVGQLDPQALFYLGSRGLKPADAQALLSLAFARETLNRMPAGGLWERLRHRVMERLAAQAGDKVMEGLL
ncbi:MAG: Fe-S cluster assembly protein SufD [Motiliproteus sp.]